MKRSDETCLPTGRMEAGMRSSVSALAWRLVLTAAAGLLFAGGCATQEWRNPDGTIITGKVSFQKEPTTGRTYQLYIPTTYNPRAARTRWS